VTCFALVSTSTALAAGKPFAETTAASSVGETTATLNGVVDPNGAETKYYFEYGTTESYGKVTAEVSAGSGESNVKVSKAVTGLTKGKKYYFRVVAKNSVGTSQGSSEVFRTTGLGQPTVETKAATEVSISTVTLNGVVNPEGYATEYRFEYGTTSVEEHKTEWVSAGSGTTNVAVSSKLTALKVDTKYEFRLEAQNEYGKATGATLTFTTKGSTKAPEFTPANGQSIRGTGGEFQLTLYGATVTCTNETTTGGSVTGKYTVGKVAMTLTGCVVTASSNGNVGCKVSSTGLVGGEIRFNPLKGQLGTVATTEAANGIGLLLEPEAGKTWATFLKSEKEGGNACSPEQNLEGKLAVEVGVLGSRQTTNKFTAPSALIKEITLASSGETVKPKLTSFGETEILVGVNDVTFGEATEVT